MLFTNSDYDHIWQNILKRLGNRLFAQASLSGIPTNIPPVVFEPDAPEDSTIYPGVPGATGPQGPAGAAGAAGFSAINVTPLTDQPTLLTDASLGCFFTVTIAGDRLLQNPSNAINMQPFTWMLKQDGTGGHALTWGSKFQFQGANPYGVLLLNTDPGARNYIGAVYNAADDVFDILAFDPFYDTGNGVLPTRTISTFPPLFGGGDLSANRTIQIQQANSNNDGYLSSADWNYFNNKGSVVTIQTNAPLTGGNNNNNNFTLGIPQANANSNGYLSSSDWSSFNNKQAAGNYALANRNINTSAPITGGGTLASDLTIAIPQADSNNNGYLSSADWNTFNNKQASGSYVSQTTQVNTTAPLTGGGPLNNNLTLAMPQANNNNNGYLAATDWAIFSAMVPNTRTVSTSAPLSGGGALNANLTLSIPQANASANGYLASSDFNNFSAKQSTLSAANANNNGFLTSTDWIQFEGASQIQTGPYTFNNFSDLTKWIAIPGNPNLVNQNFSSGVMTLTGNASNNANYFRDWTGVRSRGLFYPDANNGLLSITAYFNNYNPPYDLANNSSHFHGLLFLLRPDLVPAGSYSGLMIGMGSRLTLNNWQFQAKWLPANATNSPNSWTLLANNNFAITSVNHNFTITCNFYPSELSGSTGFLYKLGNISLSADFGSYSVDFNNNGASSMPLFPELPMWGMSMMAGCLPAYSSNNATAKLTSVVLNTGRFYPGD
jgi:hypothetical protein